MQAFAPSALHDSSPATAVDSKSKVKPSKAKRRVDAHIAAHNDSSDAERGMTQPKGSLWRRGRKLSKSTRPPLVETISLPTLQNLQGEEGAPPHVLGSRMGAAESTPDLVKPFPILKAEKEKKRPPVSGENHLTGVGEEVRTRKRTNSFKKGLAGTLRVSEWLPGLVPALLVPSADGCTSIAQCSLPTRPPRTLPSPRPTRFTPMPPLPTPTRCRHGLLKAVEARTGGPRSARDTRTPSTRGESGWRLFGARRVRLGFSVHAWPGLGFRDSSRSWSVVQRIRKYATARQSPLVSDRSALGFRPLGSALGDNVRKRVCSSGGIPKMYVVVSREQ